MFRGAELTRLLTSLVMLAVLGMLIVQAQDARNFRWLCGKQAAGGPVDPANSIHGRPAEEETGSAGPGASSAKKPPQGGTTKEKPPQGGTTNAARPAANRTPTAPLRAHGKPLDLPPPPTGPTDLDEEERDAAAEEFLALTDRTLEMHPEEMNAYWRLFSWVQNQSLAGLSKRAVKDVVLNDFIQSPDDFRGRLVALELNVRRVLRHPATKNPLGIKNIYEVTGFTTESQAWLYFGLTADLPKDMPVGSSVEEQATFYGYFLKLQGYYRAGAKPNEQPLEAPVLIGRMVWHSAAAAEAKGESFSQVFWMAITGAALVVAGGVWLIVRLVGGPPAAVRGRTLRPPPTVPMDQWLRTAAEGGLEIDRADAEPAESDAAEGDGQSEQEYGGGLGGLRSVGEPGELSGGNGASDGHGWPEARP
jgi:hypothetical protein